MLLPGHIVTLMKTTIQLNFIDSNAVAPRGTSKTSAVIFFDTRPPYYQWST